MRYFRAIVFWTAFWIITLILFLILCVLRPIFYVLRIPNFDSLCHSFAVIWSRLIFFFTPGWSISVAGKEHIPSEGGFVIVSNHESLTDIWAIFCINVQFRWLSKAEVFKVPVVGTAMHWARYIPIKRGNKESHAQSFAASVATIKRGVPMLYFPEGTRSDDGNMREFKIGAFKLAADTNTFVLPIVVKGTRQLIPKGSWLPARSHVSVKVLAPVYRIDNEDMQAFASRTRALILGEFQKI